MTLWNLGNGSRGWCGGVPGSHIGSRSDGKWIKGRQVVVVVHVRKTNRATNLQQQSAIIIATIIEITTKGKNEPLR